MPKKTLDSHTGWTLSEPIAILSPEGFHARPAALLVKAAKQRASDIELRKGEWTCNAKSLVSVMGLALKQGDAVVVAARGADADAAIDAIAPILSGTPGGGEKTDDTPADTDRPHTVGDNSSGPPAADGTLRGVTAAPGMALGNAARFVRRNVAPAENAGTPDEERAKLREALTAAKDQLRGLRDRTAKAAGEEEAAIFDAHAEILDDPDLLGAAERGIAAGKATGTAWQAAYEERAAMLAAVKDERISGRSADVVDVGRRVLENLTGTPQAEHTYPADTILVAEELSPSDTASLDRERIVGFCTVHGGATSHIAILARSLAIPALVGLPQDILNIPDGTPLLLDADNGRLTLDPPRDIVAKMRGEREAAAAKRAEDLRNAAAQARTRDGKRIEVAANIGGTADAQQAAAIGADGVGLLRSEFLFLDRETPPDEEEQAAVYTEIAKALGPDRPLIVRTLDVGGDKPLAYIDRPREENPFLGVRGLRLSLRRRDLFETQLRAILRAAAFCDLHIMFPMVSTLAEFREANQILRKLRNEMQVTRVKVGIMVEVPSAAILARHFAKEVDFLSLGTNDLAQYTLAADRGNANLSDISDGLDPSVLALIRNTVEGTRGSDCWVGVCGGLAADPQAVPLLVGLGVTELSVDVPAVPTIKALVRDHTLEECRALAEAALDMQSAAEIRTYLRNGAKH